MKTRLGFVSNSSSSSFVIITTKKNFERALKKASKFEKEVVTKLFDDTKFMGKDMKIATTFSDAGGGGTFENFEDMTDEDNDDEETSADAFDSFVDKLEECKDEVISRSIDS